VLGANRTGEGLEIDGLIRMILQSRPCRPS